MTTPDLPIPANLPATLDFLGPAPLIRTEQHAGYDTLLARVSGAVKPADIFEEFRVRDIVDLVCGQGARGAQCPSPRIEPAGAARSDALARGRGSGAADRKIGRR
jgi:hypothetical protein